MFHAHVARVRARQGQRGETLVELMVAIVLLSTGVIACITGLFSLSTSADYNHNVSQASLLAQSYAEQLLQPVPTPTTPPTTSAFSPSTYIPCAGYSGHPNYPAYVGPSTYTHAGTVTSAYTVRIVAIQWLQGATFAGGSFGPICTDYPLNTLSSPAVPEHDNGLQQIYIEAYANTPGHPDRELLVIVKRDARCPSQVAFSNPDQGPC